MDTKASRFLRHWAAAVLVFTACLAGFNYIMDPYLLMGSRRISHFNARKPAASTRQPMMKAYDVLRRKAGIVLLGSSRVAIGVDAEQPLLRQHGPAYNLGMPGASPYMAYRYLQHVLAHQRVGLVILTLEFQYFVQYADSYKSTFESRLAVKPDGTLNPHREGEHIVDLTQAFLSLESVKDSVRTLAGNLSEDSSNLTSGTWYYPELVAAIDSYRVFSWTDLAYFKWYAGKPRNDAMMANVRAVLELCRAQGTRVILVLTPSHADELEVLDEVGYWPLFEHWKRQIVALGSQYSQPEGGPVEVWDFNDYDAYSTEAVPKDGRKPHWFWDTAHFTQALGELMMKRLFGASDVRFGTRVSPENVDAHLAAIRARQRQYRQQHPSEARRVRAVYEALFGKHPSPVEDPNLVQRNQLASPAGKATG